MSINSDYSWIYETLPDEVYERICTCTKKGWHFSPETGYWTCGKCNKPSYFAARLTCDGCMMEFIGDKARADDDSSLILCYLCLEES